MSEIIPVGRGVEKRTTYPPDDSPSGDNKDHRLFFKRKPGKVTIEGIKEQPGAPASIPEGTPTFKFVAEFKGRKAGHYVIHWRVKLLENFNARSGLRFSAAVSYDNEPDTSGSLDVALESEELETLVKDRLYDLQLEELVVIQPYEGNVTVELSLSNIENERRLEYCGLQVDFVEFKPFAGDNEGQSKHKLGHK
ncbi:hypothetical protein BGZ65_002319 [Modicella reniformis]|uniref:Uncharacterized protein n=1 Tax=Modicella reniformis TaxID=1440133 RepID=A0A9P6ILF0_9FUNG|nr:hypothetical protein BGZ65_002319 [Modicella reniformis]